MKERFYPAPLRLIGLGVGLFVIALNCCGPHIVWGSLLMYFGIYFLIILIDEVQYYISKEGLK